MDGPAPVRGGSAGAAQPAGVLPSQAARQGDCVDAAPSMHRGEAAHATRPFLTAGNPRPVIEAAVDALARGTAPVLGVVLETEGSTYARVGALALFTDDGQVGWLSGGCLEPELARRAAQAGASGRLDWLEIDTRDDAALFSGAALGCRGRLRIALLPLAALPFANHCLPAWLDGEKAVEIHVSRDGAIGLRTAGGHHVTLLPCEPPAWAGDRQGWTLPLPRLPEVLLLGAGPETPTLIRLLRELGWRVAIVEPRPRWQDACAGADARSCAHAPPDDALRRADVALVMHHDFERDLAALETLAREEIAFVGLLGPPRRRDDLCKLLDASARAALQPRLHAPVGLDLGGQGPEAIALSIAAQLQAWRASAPAPVPA